MTFAEVCVGTAVVFTLIGGMPVLMGKCDNGTAADNAAAYASKVGLTVIEVSDRDTDMDGYVSVTFRDRDGALIGGQCGTGYGFACISGTETCKLDTGKAWGPRGLRR